MTRDEFITKVEEEYPTSRVPIITTVLHEESGIDNYVAVLDTGDGPFVVGSEGGVLLQVLPEYLDACKKEMERAIRSINFAQVVLAASTSSSETTTLPE